MVYVCGVYSQAATKPNDRGTCCTGSEEEAAKLADAAEAASKHSLVQSQRAATAATATSGLSDSGTPAASSTSSGGAATGAASTPGGRSAQPAGSPQKPPSGLRVRKAQQHQQSKGRVSEGQKGAIAAAANPSDAIDEDELPPVMTWKVS